MKKILFIIVTSILIFFLYFLLSDTDDSYEQLDKKQADKDEPIASTTTLPTLPTEQFIKKYLLDDDETIRTNFAHKEKKQSHRLSESLGLWMEYLVEKKDLSSFKRATEVLESRFLLQNNIVAWEIKDGKRATTNALIDDLRIIEALFKEGERTKTDHFIHLAKEICESVVLYNQLEDNFVDFYDIEYNYATTDLTISYVNPEAFYYMEKYECLSSQQYNKILDFLENLPTKHGFYPKTFDTVQNEFIYDKEVNLIDQLYTVIHLERAHIDTHSFFNWLKEIFYKENILYGRYEQVSKQPTVDYEGSSVYALAIIYSVEKKEYSFAYDLFQQMEKLQVKEKDDKYYGGYVNEELESTHSFDNLLPLIAERILQVEEIIE